MPKSSSIFVCQQCGYQSASFLGKCPQCESWNSFMEQIEEGSRVQGIGSSKKHLAGKVEYLQDVQKHDYSRVSTQIGEFDRCLGGGIVKGSVVLISGDPGVGKSTLLTQLALNIGNQELGIKNQGKGNTAENHDSKFMIHDSILYVAGEESAHQIKLRVDRINPQANFPVLNEIDVDIIIATIKELKPGLVIIDSIQTLITSDLVSAAGSVSQVRECASRLQRLAKEMHIPVFIVGHVTKEGVIAGPRTLEHLVDVVLSLEGDSTTQFRILRVNKNRFGSTDEVGIFDMSGEGMKEITNPSEIFLETQTASLGTPGSAIVPILTGLRPILVEIQALVTKTNLPVPRRVGTGVDNNRLQILVAVLQKRLKLSLWEQDIYVNVTGGLKVTEPAADLAICMAILSSFKEKANLKGSAFIGEVGLLGELRNVTRIDKRESEAIKLGYKNVITPAKYKTLNEVSAAILK